MKTLKYNKKVSTKEREELKDALDLLYMFKSTFSKRDIKKIIKLKNKIFKKTMIKVAE